MRKKLQILGILLSLVLITAYVNSTTLPNQQIVVQLSNSESSVQESDFAIEKIKSILVASGAKQISIKKAENGHLKITYYSSSEIYEIQHQLAENINFTFGDREGNPFSQIPEEPNDGNYVLKISELNPEQHSNGGFESVEVQVSNLKADRFSHIKHNNLSGLFCVRTITLKMESKRNSFYAFSWYTDESNYGIPEVRAGPLHRFA